MKLPLLLSLLLPACGSLAWDNHILDLVVCDAPEERSRGLMGHAALRDNQGMLFVYPEARDCTYWMKDVPFPIDLAFIGSDGRVLDIAAMKPLDENAVSSPGKVKFVLEMRAGWFKDHGIGKSSLWKDVVEMDWPDAK